MKAKPTLSNIKGFLSAHYRQALDELGFLESHIKEQALFRLWLVNQRSPKCFEEDTCVECSCQISSKVFESRGCSANICYGEMLDQEKWEEYKKIHPIYKKYLKGDTNITQSCSPMIIFDMSKQESLAELMQNNPTLTKEELLYWCPEFQEPLSQVVQEPNGHFIIGYDDAPGIKGTKFKIKLSKDQSYKNGTESN